MVLPGPPLEIEAIWNDRLKDFLSTMQPKMTHQLFKWQLQGVPESEAATKLEEILKPLTWKVGYRASKMRVQLKVWVPVDEMRHFAEKEKQILQTFGAFIDNSEQSSDS